jgi:hypothetical protein
MSGLPSTLTNRYRRLASFNITLCRLTQSRRRSSPIDLTNVPCRMGMKYGISLQRGLGWLAVCPAEAVPYLYQAPLRSRIGPFDTIEVKRLSTANFVSGRLRPARSTTAPQTTLPIAPASTTDRCLCDPVGVSQLPRIGYYAMATAEHRSRVTRESHARFWERPEVKFLRTTRQ